MYGPWRLRSPRPVFWRHRPVPSSRPLVQSFRVTRYIASPYLPSDVYSASPAYRRCRRRCTRSCCSADIAEDRASAPPLAASHTRTDAPYPDTSCLVRMCYGLHSCSSQHSQHIQRKQPRHIRIRMLRFFAWHIWHESTTRLPISGVVPRGTRGYLHPIRLVWILVFILRSRAVGWHPLPPQSTYRQ